MTKTPPHNGPWLTERAMVEIYEHRMDKARRELPAGAKAELLARRHRVAVRAIADEGGTTPAHVESVLVRRRGRDAA